MEPIVVQLLPYINARVTQQGQCDIAQGGEILRAVLHVGPAGVDFPQRGQSLNLNKTTETYTPYVPLNTYDPGQPQVQ